MQSPRQSNVQNESILEQNKEEDVQIWAGMKVKNPSGNVFGKKSDRTTNWQKAYFKGGLF
jgi:hypothetical protein